MIGALLLAACRAEGDDTAALAPYTDCELAFDSDCDGDGAVGSEDCDDHDAGEAPGQAEVGGDDLDNDCDGRTDEVVVCAEGGDFATIAAGIDGTPDGGVLELCPGRYAEAIAADGRSITIEGGGEEPEDVVVDFGAAGLELGVSWLGHEPSLVLRDVAMLSDRTLLLHTVGVIELESVIVCTPADFVVEHDVSAAPSSLLISRTFTCGGASVSARGHNPDFRGDVVESLFGGGLNVTNDSGGQVEVRNNLVHGSASFVVMAQESARSSVTHNTVVGAAWVVSGVYRFVDDPPWKGSFSLGNNLMEGGEASTWSFEMWLFYDAAPECESISPGALAPNLVWGFDTRSATCSSVPSVGDEDVAEASVPELLSGLMTEDPLLVNTWWPGSGSPAEDAGSGEDPDGSPADLGAFGGEHGDWWKEVSWLGR